MRSSSRITQLGIQSVPLEGNAVERHVFLSRIAQRSREQRHRWKVVVHFDRQDLFETRARACPGNVNVFSQAPKLARGLGHLRVRQIKYKIAYLGVPGGHQLSRFLFRIFQREHLAFTLQACLQVTGRPQQKLRR